MLERSGIGSPDVLKRADVPTLVASPHVGENLREHRGILLVLRLAGGWGYNHQLDTRSRQLRTLLNYLVTRRGVMSHGGSTLLGMYASDPSSGPPDTQAFFMPISATRTDPKTGRAMIDALARTRTIIGTEPFASIVNYEQMPGPAIDEAATARFATEHGFTANHSVGTCAMRSGNGVLDDQLRVHGTRNLRVIDASVFPSMPSGNTMAPTMALAWIAADLIRNTPAGRRS